MNTASLPEKGLNGYIGKIIDLVEEKIDNEGFTAEQDSLKFVWIYGDSLAKTEHLKQTVVAIGELIGIDIKINYWKFGNLSPELKTQKKHILKRPGQEILLI